MKMEQAKALAMVIENCMGDEYSTRVEPSYSGWGMCGATTAAVYTKASWETLTECILERIAELNELGVDFKDISIRYDSMGLGYVYY